MPEADKEKEKLKKEVGRRFNLFRSLIKKSQRELANELQVSQATIAGIERGICFPHNTVLKYLYWHYHLNLNWLLTGSVEMIIPPVMDSKTDNSFQIDDSTSRVESYEELYTLMRIPVIEQVIFAKLSELKVIAEEEIKSFYEGP